MRLLGFISIYTLDLKLSTKNISIKTRSNNYAEKKLRVLRNLTFYLLGTILRNGSKSQSLQLQTEMTTLKLVLQKAKQ